MSNVISLLAHRPQHSTVICPQLGLRFPKVFRVTCDPMKLEDGAARAQLGSVPFVFYTLGTPMDGISESLRPGCVATEITSLDPAVDRPGVSVRHHASYEQGLAYIDAIADTGIPPSDIALMSLENAFFSVLAHDTPPYGAPAHTLCYFASVPGADGAASDAWEQFAYALPSTREPANGA